MDCVDLCPHDPRKTKPGICDCGTSDRDSDNDGTPDCNDDCPLDPSKTAPGQYGCGNDVCECPCGGSTALEFLLKSPYDESMCADWVDTGAGANMQNVIMKSCDGTERQLWSMEDGERLKVVSDAGVEVCMEWHFDGPEPLNVWANACGDGAHQKWFFVGQQLKNRHDPTYCLDWDAGSINGGDGFNIYMRKCETQGLTSQYWFKSEFDSETKEHDKELTIQITTCADTYSSSVDAFFISANGDPVVVLDTVDDKAAGQMDSYLVPYSGALDSLVISAEGSDNWQICRLVLNGYLFWNKGDEQGATELWLSDSPDDLGAPSAAGAKQAVDLLPFFSEEDSGEYVAPTTPAAECTDAPENWSEGEGDTQFTCAWYAQQLADPNFNCDDSDYVGTDGKTASEACCVCGGGSAMSGVATRPPAVETCNAGIDTCLAARDAEGRHYTYIVCPENVEQKDTKYGDYYLLGKAPTVADDGSMSFSDGSATGCPDARARSIHVRFVCGQESVMEISEPEVCSYEGVLHHPCACESK